MGISDEWSSTVARFLFATTLFFTGLIQASLLPSLALLEIMPNFALVFLLIWSASYGPEEGMLWAFGLGLWLDVLTLAPLGTHSIALLVVALVGGAVRGQFFRSGAILPVVAVIGATLAFGMIRMTMQYLSGGPVSFVASLRLAVIAAFLNALVVPFAYGALLMFERWAPRRVS